MADNPRADIIEKLDVFSDQDNRNTTAIQDSIKKYADWSAAKVDLQMAANHSELLNKIESIQKKLASSCEMLQATSHRLILEGIAFPDMDSRLGHIEDQGQAKGTFEWLVKDNEIPKSQQGSLTMSFRQWLSDDPQGIFHIAGKPGSGKSTLMRFLKEHPETRAQLRKWAAEGGDNSEPIVAAVFFWNAGSRSQKSLNGLYRTLLHSILESHPKDLIPLLFPDRLVSLNSDLLRISQGARGEKIPDGEVAAAFLKLIGGTVSRLRFCLFIDGADEFSDPNFHQWKLARDIKAWVNSNPKRVKICVSSREEQPWLDHFNNYPRLTIHLTTDPDIEAMIRNSIGEHPNFEVFDPWEARSFVIHFVRIAEGVFLWVKLILVDVVAMLDYGKDIKDLKQALKSYPPELDGLFDKIMRDKVRNKEEALTILKIMIMIEWCDFRVQNFAFVKDALSGKIRCGGQWPEQSAREENEDRVDKFITSVPLLFGGLVVVTFDGDLHPETLDFNHRSVYQYLGLNLQGDSRDKAKVLRTALQCLVAGMQMLESGCGRYNQFDDDDTWFILELVMSITKSDEITQKSCFSWLEEIEQHLFRLSDVNISEEDANPKSKLDLEARRGLCCILVLSACCDLVSYVEWALSRSTCTSRWITTAQAQAATLDYIIYSSFDRDIYDDYSDDFLLSLRIFLLEKPDRQRIIDPNALVNTRSCGQVSIWQYFIIRMTLKGFLFMKFPKVWDAVGLFLECGARPGIYISWSVGEIEGTKNLRRLAEGFTALCLVDIAVTFSDSPSQGQDGVQTEEECGIEPPALEWLKEEMPNGGSLRDIFLLFGPKDRPNIQKLLEAEESVERDGAKRQRLCIRELLN
jgi:hypothetical protein